MKKIIVLIIVVMLVFSFAGCQSAGEKSSDKITVAASVVPVATFVEKVAGDLVDVITVVPPGNSPANYQPTTTEMQALSDADVYFVVQVPTEEANILNKIYDFNPDVKLVNLRDKVSAVYPLREMAEHHHDEEGEAEHHDEAEEMTTDPHIWLSPQRAIVMVNVIAETLSELDSGHTALFKANAEAYIQELTAADEEIKQIVSGLDNRAFMIYHGAYGYFADDYGFEMIAIESDGKEVTAATMRSLIEDAKAKNIKTIFYQDEFDDNQAQIIAEELGGVVQETAPLSPDYIDSLITFANALAGN